MFKSFPVGSPLGIPVRIQGLFVVFFALLGSYFLVAEGVAQGLGTLLLLGAAFSFVVLHELGHAVVARELGVRVVDVTVWPLGGMARLENVPDSGRVEIAIAAAGPLVNLVLAYLLFCGRELSSALGLAGAEPLAFMGWINLLLAAFNMLPAFPLDGGRILRSLLAGAIGFEAATRAAVLVGRILALGLCAAALLGGMPFLVVVSAFIFLAAGLEERSEADPDACPRMPAPDPAAAPAGRSQVASAAPAVPRTPPAA